MSIKKQLKTAILVAGRIVVITDNYATKLEEEFKTSKTAQFDAWDMYTLEWR